MRRAWIGSAAAMLMALAAPAGAGPLQPATSSADRYLLEAAYYCDTDDALEALESGANVNAQDPRRQTPLMLAAFGACEELVGELLARGADLAAEDAKGETALDLARRVEDADVEALLEAALAEGAAPAPPLSVGTAAQAAADALAAAATALRTDNTAPQGFVPWPELGAYAPGQDVISTWAPAAKWDPGVVVKLDRDYKGYHVEDRYHSVMPFTVSEVVAPNREPFWTGWFVGDWKVSVPVAMNTTTKGDGRKYATVTGGMALPPLSIHADGTYTWKLDDAGEEKLLEGHWVPRPDAPGVILQNGAEGADWIVYNSTDNVIDHDEIHLSNPRFTYYTASRIEDAG
jgi:hypothetical protein